MTIGQRIKAIMDIKGLTQSDLGNIADYSGVAVGKIVNDKSEPKFAMLNAIIEEYEDINAYWLLAEKENMFRSKLSFNNEVEMLRYMKDNIEDFKKLSSFEELISNTKESDMYSDVLKRLELLEKRSK